MTITIIIEGCDNTGKTSLVRAIQKELLLRGHTSSVLKASQPIPGVHPLDEYALPLFSAPSEIVICDRWHVGEDVYGPLYRDRSRLTAPQRIFLDGLIAARGGTFVHVTAKAEVVRKRCEDQGEDFLKLEHVEDCLDAFAFETADDAHWVTIDTSDTTVADLAGHAQDIVQVAFNRYRDTQRAHWLDTDYVGPAWPRVLLLGDKPAHDEDTGTNRAYAALTPWNGNCADYLISRLIDIGVLARRNVPTIGWVNSWQTPIRPLWETLGHPPVIALGNEAAKRARKEMVPLHGSVYHPQYVRRFLHHDGLAYAESIAKLIRTS